MTEIIMKDQLREEAERESGGKQTVLYTQKGQPSYFNIVPAFRLEDVSPDLGAGLHPAFLVAGKEKAEIFVATYQAVIRSGEALSLPIEDPAVNVDFDEARAACLACGPGFHLMSNLEWAALALQCAKNGFGQLHGNTSNGSSHLTPEERGPIAKYGRTRTGSGPDTWRHDGTPFGIADLVGNTWEWVDGMKLQSGKILMPVGNDFLLPEDRWPDTGARFDFSDGGLRVSDTIDDGTRDYDSEIFGDLHVEDGFNRAELLRQALLLPISGLCLDGRIWVDNTEGFEALPVRGGGWGNGDYAGLAALNLNYERSSRSIDLGFRPAFAG